MAALDHGTEKAGKDLLRALVDGTCSVVVIRHLLPEADFSANRRRISPLFERAVTTHYANSTLTTIGPYLAKNIGRMDDYFHEAREAEKLTATVSFDLARRTRDALREAFDLTSFEPAVEPDGQRYAESNVRIYSHGIRTPLHNDNIMRDAAGKGLVVSRLRHQLSCVVCIQECDEGGELRAYQKAWESADERYKIIDGFGYDEAVVADVPRQDFKPQVGDVYLLNPTFYHSIEEVTGSDRVTMGFFFGFYDDELSAGVTWV
ncbi:2OG-Fe(II) oxygenase [Streptomyces atriruber]|uniref:2OG-Fe(II)-dependent halogenase WelO5 family protein n=1 Tax=Streptomyces atriruber TaxID=545121 RepID=UPI0006E1927B|nr:2OG-Fe(II) oxygenase [Streptomyces atriruber]